VFALLLAAVLRLVGLGWGIPRYDAPLAAATPLRTSFHPDEDKMLWQLMAMQPRAFDFHPRDFGWGTLQTYLVGAVLWTGGRFGAFGGNWRGAFADPASRGFEQVFVAGRLVTAAFGIATVLLAGRLACDAAGRRAGAWAALLLAVSPLHVVHSHFLTADAAAGFWVLLAASALARRPDVMGIALGLAIATKPSAVFALVLLVFSRPPRLRALLGVPAGFLAGEPYALLAFGDYWETTRQILVRSFVPSAEAFGLGELLGRHTLQLACYGVGPLAFVLGIGGIAGLPPPLVALGGSLWITLSLSRFPMARYELPLVPLLCVSAGIALARFRPGLGIGLGVPTVLLGLGVSAGQLSLLVRPHTAQQAADWIVQQITPGARVVQLFPEYPLLDPVRYRTSGFGDPFALEGSAYRPLEADVAILDDLPLHALRHELRDDLARRYFEAAAFGRAPRLGPFELPEPWLPHDLRYTHPRIRVLRRR
jgi:hypothetical protein